VEKVVKEVVKGVEQIVEEIKQVAIKCGQFVIKIANTAYTFIMDTATTMLKGVAWVFQKIGATIQDIIDFLGFFFSWGDALTTADSIAACFEVTLDYGKGMIDSIDKKIDANLEQLRSNIKTNLARVQGVDYKSATAKASVSGADQKTDDDNDSQSGVAHNWGSYQFTHGGATHASAGDTNLGKTARSLSV
jgi:phage-related protein